MGIDASTGKPWWRELEVVLLAALVIGIYIPRLTTLTIRGEESRRAQVAAEILETGDWVVPRQQGNVFDDRPPAGSWPIALLAMMRGKMDVVTVRLPTVAAILLTTLLIYGYSRSYLSRFGALTAAAAFATMGQVLQLGRLAENEGTFTLVVAASLSIWHWGYMKRWSPAVMWSAGYALCALAGLIKGPQGPIYFGLATWCYLLLRRDWKTLLGRGHLVGLVTFAVVLGSWQVPYYLRTSWSETVEIWVGQSARRFTEYGVTNVVKHLVSYPLEVLACMLPWSAVLIGFFYPSLCRSVRNISAQVLFLLVALVVTFPTVWFAAGAVARYYMPMYPLVAVLIGLAMERWWQAAHTAPLRIHYRRFMVGMALVAVVAGVTILAVGFIDHPRAASIAQPAAVALVFLALSVGLAIVLWRVKASRSPLAFRTAVLLIAAYLGFCHTVLVVNGEARVMEHTAAAVATAKSKLPSDVQLVSFGIVSHLFRYHYRTPIEAVPWPEDSAEVDDNTYFCFNEAIPLDRELPFKWELIDVVSMDREHTPRPHKPVVVIGRKTSDRDGISQPRHKSTPDGGP